MLNWESKVSRYMEFTYRHISMQDAPTLPTEVLNLGGGRGELDQDSQKG